MSCDCEQISFGSDLIDRILAINQRGLADFTSLGKCTVVFDVAGDIVGQPARNFLSPELLHIRGRLQIAAGTGVIER
jgi:hypothetical protein